MVSHVDGPSIEEFLEECQLSIVEKTEIPPKGSRNLPIPPNYIHGYGKISQKSSRKGFIATRLKRSMHISNPRMYVYLPLRLPGRASCS